MLRLPSDFTEEDEVRLRDAQKKLRPLSPQTTSALGLLAAHVFTCLRVVKTLKIGEVNETYKCSDDQEQ
jgi:hypothetical protein